MTLRYNRPVTGAGKSPPFADRERRCGADPRDQGTGGALRTTPRRVAPRSRRAGVSLRFTAHLDHALGLEAESHPRADRQTGVGPPLEGADRHDLPRRADDVAAFDVGARLMRRGDRCRRGDQCRQRRRARRGSGARHDRLAFVEPAAGADHSRRVISPSPLRSRPLNSSWESRRRARRSRCRCGIRHRGADRAQRHVEHRG